MKKRIRAFGGAVAFLLFLCQIPLNLAYAAGLTKTAQNAAQAVQVETHAEGLLPLRYIMENCGYTVVWNEDRSIRLQKEGTEMELRIDSDAILLNGERINLHYTPILVDGETYLPVEFYHSVLTDKYIVQVGANAYTLMDKAPVLPENMMDTVRELSQYPRHSSDETHEAAMRYVIDKLTACGYAVEKQEFAYEMLDWEQGGWLTRHGANLIAVKEADVAPTGDVLIIGAHYDGAPGAPAANDNASGLSVLLELARVLRDLPSDTEIRFVAFDAEEDGLFGSKEYVERLTDTQNIIGMLNFDMLGGEKAKHVGIHTADDRESYLMDVLRLNCEFCGVERGNQSYGSSDYQFFPARLIPALDFSHPAIRGEYHSENDRAEYVSADMLEYAAKAGAAIATTIMSNITPSYLDQAKPWEPDGTLTITPETYIPVSGTLEQVERAFGIPLTQIESDIRAGSMMSSLNYRIKTRLFGLEQDLYLVYSSTTRSVAGPYIDLTDSGLTYEEAKTLLDETLGAGKPVEPAETGSAGSLVLSGADAAFSGAGTEYVYNSLYGNSFRLSYTEGNAPRLILSIRAYQDDNKEVYRIENDELVRMDGTDLTRVYTVKRTAEGVSVAETSPQPAYDLKVSERARQCWDRLRSALTAEDLNQFTYLVLESDGYGHESVSATNTTGGEMMIVMLGNEDVEVPEAYQDLSESVQSVIRYLLARGEDGDVQTTSEGLPGRRLTVDNHDLLDEAGSAYTDADFVKALAVMKGTMLFDRQEQSDDALAYPEEGTPFENITYNMKRGGEMYPFAFQFYHDIYSTERYYNYDLFSKYPGEFVCEAAARSITDDMAHSFSKFVVGEKPTGDSVIERKIRFFYDFPALVSMRDELRRQM